MTQINDLLARMRQNPADVSFKDLCKVCDALFGKPRSSSGSHRIYKTPWQGDPHVNIQNQRGKAKAYQVRQVLKALNRLEAEHG